MPVTPDQPGPYSPASAVLEIVNRHRNRGLPSPVNADVLGRAGISDSLIPRTLQALQTLDLIDGDGNVTSVLEGIRKAPEADYQKRLKEWLTSAYADVLQYIDPQTATDTEIRDAFRSYNPVGQQPRMVTLFSGLFRAAGVGPDKPLPTSRKAKPGSGTSKPRPNASAKPKRQKNDVSGSSAVFNTNGIPPALAGLLSSLPPQGKRWSETDFEAFVNTFQAVLSFCYPPLKPGEVAEETDDDEIADDE